MMLERLGSQSPNLHRAEAKQVVYGKREPNAYAGARDVHDDVSDRSDSFLAEQLVTLNADGAAHPDD